jgi:formylmethanofuran dehydrogenase subunit E
MQSLESILRESAKRHKHLCPRQVLGARMSLLAGEILELELPRADKRLLVIAETDGCTVDGIIAATGCHVGGRTLRIVDFGKVAATFLDTYTEEAIRIVPNRRSRALASDYSPNARNDWEAMLLGYQLIPADNLFIIQRVQLINSLAKLISKPTKKSECKNCGEEIINGREVIRDGLTLCRACAGECYYQISLRPQSLLTDIIMDHLY